MAVGAVVACRSSFLPKIQSLGVEIPIFGKCRGTVEILSTHISCRKFSAVCQKIASSSPQLLDVMPLHDINVTEHDNW